MKQAQHFYVAIAGVALVLAGLTWLFGAWSLVAVGAVLVVWALVADVKE